eukprot:g560.t1
MKEHEEKNGFAQNGHPLVRIKDPYFGNLEFHSGEDMFGEFDDELTPEQQKTLNAESASRRREYLWNKFEETLPYDQRDHGMKSRVLFDTNQGRGAGYSDMKLHFDELANEADPSRQQVPTNMFGNWKA